MSVFWLAQAIGLVGLGFSMLAYQSKTRDLLLARQMTGAFTYMLHFGLLSAWTGVAMNGIVALRNWVFVKKDTHAWARNELWMWFFVALVGVSLYFTWQGAISLLPAIAMLLGIYSRWKGTAKEIRAYSLAGCLLWLPYDLSVRSYSGVLVDILVAGVIIFGMWRHDRPRAVDPV